MAALISSSPQEDTLQQLYFYSHYLQKEINIQGYGFNSFKDKRVQGRGGRQMHQLICLIQIGQETLIAVQVIESRYINTPYFHPSEAFR